jgi:hypothetical protein
MHTLQRERRGREAERSGAAGSGISGAVGFEKLGAGGSVSARGSRAGGPLRSDGGSGVGAGLLLGRPNRD